MQSNTLDLSYLKQIAEIKWDKGFKCRKCKHNEAYQSKINYSMKCKNCKCIESVTANTAFSGLRLPISKAVSLFILFQKNYVEWESNYSALWDGYYNGPVEFLKDVKMETKGSKPRPSFKSIATFLNVRAETAWHFINRIALWMPKKYWKESAAANLWFPHEKQHNKMYNALFNLLFSEEWDVEENKPFTARTENEILELLVLKRLVKRQE